MAKPIMKKPITKADTDDDRSRTKSRKFEEMRKAGTLPAHIQSEVDEAMTLQQML